ncbi:T9SS C-terminal target domain-containing protein [Ancylomarina sp. 16SWW S1-10-2]|uniref:T9SS C-terminal target domain-containing protein n=1 Tax=Ancylomarina sp. 16SWW S1-10-2 TaxID=2499681 RepID=UPI0012AD7553|nr:T9SS C-terminal target domain-containing protein [Ancylomarina sp. 16SWW S1-10-2]MRT93305.1 T9SS C-terminal target domain-containing protein [Ancylomarina sp. 16SWW S1-10-2]
MRYFTYTILGILISTLGMAQNTNVKTVVYSPLLISDQLPKSVNEQSAMLWHNNLFWVINDSDCKPELIAYNPKGQLEETILINNASNKDWEDLAEDEDYIYIGDFGNNRGSRKDLRVLRVLKSDMKNKEVTIDSITFTWADQKNFRNRNMKNNFDCEAFFACGDSLYLFTKNWINKKTRLYSMPKTPGNYKLKPITEFNTSFMVTGADISADGKTVALVGYKNYHTYMMLLTNFEGMNFFSGNVLRLDIESLGRAQTEGIVFTDKNELYINTEETRLSQAFYRVDWMKILTNTK